VLKESGRQTRHPSSLRSRSIILEIRAPILQRRFRHRYSCMDIGPLSAHCRLRLGHAPATGVREQVGARAPMPAAIDFNLNGQPVRVSAAADRNLLWVLRTDLGLTGPKFGCGISQCGACTVLVDGRAVRSCSVPVSSVKGKIVLTIEGLSAEGRLHPVQEAFIAHDALQCGFCTSGMILTACDFLRRHPKPTRDEVIAGWTTISVAAARTFA